jgi:hypothetical protein
VELEKFLTTDVPMKSSYVLIKDVVVRQQTIQLRGKFLRLGNFQPNIICIGHSLYKTDLFFRSFQTRQISDPDPS